MTDSFAYVAKKSNTEAGTDSIMMEVGIEGSGDWVIAAAGRAVYIHDGRAKLKAYQISNSL